MPRPSEILEARLEHLQEIRFPVGSHVRKKVGGGLVRVRRHSRTIGSAARGVTRAARLGAYYAPRAIRFAVKHRRKIPRTLGMARAAIGPKPLRRLLNDPASFSVQGSVDRMDRYVLDRWTRRDRKQVAKHFPQEAAVIDALFGLGGLTDASPNMLGAADEDAAYYFRKWGLDGVLDDEGQVNIFGTKISPQSAMALTLGFQWPGIKQEARRARRKKGGR